MKKSEDAAAKKKPKTSAAQIRVQKGKVFFAMTCPRVARMTFIWDFDDLLNVTLYYPQI